MEFKLGRQYGPSPDRDDRRWVMKYRDLHICFILVLSAGSIPAWGQINRNQRAVPGRSNLQSQREMVDSARQIDGYHTTDRAVIGRYRQRPVGSLSSMYPGTRYNYNSPVFRSMQRRNAYLDPMTSYYGTSSEWMRMRTSPYSVRPLGSLNVVKQRRFGPTLPKYDPRYRNSIRPDAAINQLDPKSLQRQNRYSRYDSRDLIVTPVEERLLKSHLFRAARPMASSGLKDLSGFVRELEARKPKTAMGFVHRPVGMPPDEGAGGIGSQGTDDDGLSRLMSAGMRSFTGESWSTAGDVFARMRMLGSSMHKPIGLPAGLTGTVTSAGKQKRLMSPRGLQGVPATGGLAYEAAAGESERGYAATVAAAETLRTFVGTEQSQVNNYLAQAEELLKTGQYYQAAKIYDFARAVDMDNPLPLLGGGIARLAAGEYMTSINSLFQAIELFDMLGRFKLDLTAFVVDLKALDKRRAYLERRLEMYDDFRLRFLLGFAEYYSGMEELGLQNLSKAVEYVPEEMAGVHRFVNTLKRYQSGSRGTPSSAK